MPRAACHGPQSARKLEKAKARKAQKKAEEAFIRDQEANVVEQTKRAQELEKRARGEGTDEHIDRVGHERAPEREKKARGAPAARSKLLPPEKVPQYTAEDKARIAAAREAKAKG